MKRILSKIMNLVTQGYYSKVGLDDKPLPSGLLTSNSRDSEFVRMSVYGICSNPPEGSHILVLNAQGRESNKFGFLNDFLNRKKNMKEGEVALLNTLTGSFVFLKEDGSADHEVFDADGKLVATIKVNSDGSILLKTQEADASPLASVELKPDGSGAIDVKSDLTATVGGKTILNSTGNVEATTPKFIINGNFEVNGDQVNNGKIDATKDISSKTDVFADSAGSPISLKLHQHLGNMGVNTGPPLPSGGGSPPPSNPPSTDTNGDVITGNGNSLDTLKSDYDAHKHSQANDSNGDTEEDTGTPI